MRSALRSAQSTIKAPYGDSVFVNCPFDAQYEPLLQALIFTVSDCGFAPRCALEIQNSAQARMDKIAAIIASCRYGIHDLSRIELSKHSRLPRFNMPFELGLFFGAKLYGGKNQREKIALVLDGRRNRYRASISDLSGYDPEIHGNRPAKLIEVVRDWLNSQNAKQIPGAEAILSRFNRFQIEAVPICRSPELQLNPEQLTYADYYGLVSRWLSQNSAWKPGGNGKKPRLTIRLRIKI